MVGIAYLELYRRTDICVTKQIDLFYLSDHSIGKLMDLVPAQNLIVEDWHKNDLRRMIKKHLKNSAIGWY